LRKAQVDLREAEGTAYKNQMKNISKNLFQQLNLAEYQYIAQTRYKNNSSLAASNNTPYSPITPTQGIYFG
jgi:hypothetical protein